MMSKKKVEIFFSKNEGMDYRSFDRRPWEFAQWYEERMLLIDTNCQGNALLK